MGAPETTSTQYSLNLTVNVHNIPGVLGRLTTAIGEAGGNIFAINNFVAKGPVLQRSIVVNCSSVEHQDKIETLPLFPVGDIDDLSMAYTPGVARVCVAIADVFIGVSAPDIVTPQDVESMAKDPIVFAMANPDPEIRPELLEGMVSVMATGRSDYPNQINNVLAFPGIFRGALDAKATDITENMKLAAANADGVCR